MSYETSDQIWMERVIKAERERDKARAELKRLREKIAKWREVYFESRSMDEVAATAKEMGEEAEK